MSGPQVDSPHLRKVAGPDYVVGLSVLGVGILQLVILGLYILIRRPWTEFTGPGDRWIAGFMAHQLLLIVAMALVWLVAAFVTLWTARTGRADVRRPEAN